MAIWNSITGWDGQVPNPVGPWDVLKSNPRKKRRVPGETCLKRPEMDGNGEKQRYFFLRGGRVPSVSFQLWLGDFAD